MPFTLAHPAAVLPVRRIPPLQTVPLIIGSMTPDLPYFAPGRIARWMLQTHTKIGSVVTDVPLGMLVLALLFLLRYPLTELLSDRARAWCLKALERYRHQPAAWLLAPLSVLVGAWTHLLWDSFTHSGGFMVRHSSVLAASVSIGAYTGQVCHLLQYLSSLVGIGVLWIWYNRSAPAVPQSEGRLSTIVLALVLMAAIGIGTAQAVAPAHGQTHYRVFYLLLTRTMAWFALLYLIAGTLMLSARKLRRREVGLAP
jgi:hypothetical protein